MATIGGSSTSASSPAPPPASAPTRRQQRATHTVASPTHHQQHQQQQQQQQRGGGGGGHGQSLDPNNPTSNHHATSSGNSNSAPYPDVYAHPAAIAYAAAHPRRTIPKFGPYLLLQTLGEGEFGKVKLGLHNQWGEEVAVKLIRRGNVDSSLRMSKVEREIEVLKNLKHPNIVRLYDVIETDKYIGIILEYASGGELFDHILAHRYLRERDAARLFSQLISGVWYIHQKKIVHRDLKLENLLLDRNRNVIITDFGFANRFEHKADDLMQTSCGSPCYAAPELVISEGLYVGSAVDIWSCGVILYAMLAGYLPFDDDPANPDGDNINLLYKYIVSTPLSFPDYVSAEARELLSIMLVPDPKKRTTLEGVMRHSWLRDYWGQENPENARSGGVPTAFGRSVEELERAAMESHQAKRVAYQKQMRALAAAANGGASGGGSGAGSSGVSPSAPVGQGGSIGQSSSTHVPTRTQSHRPPEPRDQHREQYSPQQQQHRSQQQQQQPTPRSRSTQPEYLYETSVDQSIMSSASGAQHQPGTPPASATAKAKGPKVYGSPAQLGLSEDDPFGPGPTAASPGGLTAPPVSGNAKAGGGAFRHTIQVEYDAPKGRKRSGSQSQKQNQSQQEREREREREEHEKRETERDKQRQQHQQQQEQERKPKPLPSPPPAGSAASSLAAPSAYRPPLSAPPPASTGPALAINVSSPPATPTSQAPAPPPSAGGSTFTTSTAYSSASGAYASETGSRTGSQHSTSSIVQSPVSTSSGQGSHKKAKSSVDRMGLGKIFGGSSSSRDASMSGRSDVSGDGEESGGVTPSAASVVTTGDEQSGGGGEREKEKERGGKEKERKTSRRNTLTVMVEPFSRSLRGKKDKEKDKDKENEKEKEKTAIKTPIAAAFARDRKPSQTAMPGVGPMSASATTMASSLAVPKQNTEKAAFSTSQEFGIVPPETPAGANSGMQASTSKAKKVMHWFRTKSKGRESVGYPVDEYKEHEKEPTPAQQLATPGQGKYKKGYSASSSTVNQQDSDKGQPAMPAPMVVVTTPGVGHGSTAKHTSSSSSALGGRTNVQPQRTASGATEGGSSSISASSFVTRFRNSVTAVGGRGSSASSSGAEKHHHLAQGQQQYAHQQQVLNAHPYSQLRIHHGAVDQTTITTRPPPEVMAHVRKVLVGMGLEMQMESEYKIRCVRGKKRKGTIMGGEAPSAEGAGDGVGVGADGQPGHLAVVTMVGSAASNGVDKRGLPLPSPSAFGGTGGMLRGLLMRRQSSQVSNHGTSASASQPSANLAFDDEHSVVVGEPLAMNTTDNGASPISPLPAGGSGSAGSLARGGPSQPQSHSNTNTHTQTVYGDPSQDAGDEVRFSVELTRLDRLKDTYSLDIRRLKGNLRSYKFLYDTLRDRADLSSSH